MFRNAILIATLAVAVLTSAAMAQTVAQEQAPIAPPQDALAASPSLTTEHLLGSSDAPHTLVLYTSLICENCAAWYKRVFPELKRTLIDTGEAKLIFRNVPVPPVEYTAPSAALALCTPPENFFAVVDVLIEGEAAVRAGGSVEAWYAPAIAVSGRSRADMDDCVSHQDTLAALNAEIQLAVDAGVSRAPSLTVDGILLFDPTLENIQSVIDAIPADRPTPTTAP